MTRPYIFLETDYYFLIYKPPGYQMSDVVGTDHDDNIILKTSDQKYSFAKYVNKLLLEQNIKSEPPIHNICNRLDLNTSGVVLVSKTHDDIRRLRKAISLNKSTVKIYLALVHGKFKKKKGIVNTLIHCEKIKKGMICHNNPCSKDTRGCGWSYYNVAKEYSYQNHNFSLVQIRIYTGKTHQVRLHMLETGHSLVHDNKYDKQDEELDSKLSKRIFLHNIYFSLTFWNEKTSTIIPLPKDLTDTLSLLTETKSYNDIYDVEQLVEFKIPEVFKIDR